jgi:hypothetical protein
MPSIIGEDKAKKQAETEAHDAGMDSFGSILWHRRLKLFARLSLQSAS